MSSQEQPHLEHPPEPVTVPEQRLSPDALIGNLGYEQWHRGVVGYAMRMGQNTHDAQDIAQTLAVKLLESQTATEIQSPVAYLATTTRNAIIDQAKKGKKEKPYEHEALQDVIEYTERLGTLEHVYLTDISIDPARIIEARDSLEHFTQTLKRLEASSPRGAKALRLVVEGYDLTGIAEHFNLTPNATSALLYRARRKMIEYIEEERVQWEAEREAEWEVPQDRQALQARAERLRNSLREIASFDNW